MQCQLCKKAQATVHYTQIVDRWTTKVDLCEACARERGINDPTKPSRTHFWIYRIAEPADWAAAQRKGHFASADLAAEGFIHFSERWQVQGVSERYYANRTDLWLLTVDETRLDAPLRRENTGGGTELFPHVYGPVPLAAVIRHAPLERDAAGVIRWPAGW